MSRQKAITIAEFDASWAKRGGRVSAFDELLNGLKELQPVAVTTGNADVLKRQTSLLSVAVFRFGKGRVRTTVADGVLYACLMPASENSK